jgi:hypothetical protein
MPQLRPGNTCDKLLYGSSRLSQAEYPPNNTVPQPKSAITQEDHLHHSPGVTKIKRFPESWFFFLRQLLKNTPALYHRRELLGGTNITPEPPWNLRLNPRKQPIHRQTERKEFVPSADWPTIKNVAEEWFLEVEG